MKTPTTIHEAKIMLHRKKRELKTLEATRSETQERRAKNATVAALAVVAAACPLIMYSTCKHTTLAATPLCISATFVFYCCLTGIFKTLNR